MVPQRPPSGAGGVSTASEVARWRQGGSTRAAAVSVGAKCLHEDQRWTQKVSQRVKSDTKTATNYEIVDFEKHMVFQYFHATEKISRGIKMAPLLGRLQECSKSAQELPGGLKDASRGAPDNPRCLRERPQSTQNACT